MLDRIRMCLAAVALGIGLGSPLVGFLSGGKVELGLLPIGALGMIAATVLAAVFLHFIPGLIGCIILIGFFTGGGRSPELLRIVGTRRNPVPPLAEMVCYAVSGAAAGAVITIGIGLYQHLSGLAETAEASALIAFLFHGYSRIYMVVTAGVAWTMTAVLTADLLFTGLTSYTDMARRTGNGRRVPPATSPPCVCLRA